MDRFDVMAVLGVALLTGGGYWVYPPLALFIPGAALIIAAVLGARGAGGISNDRATTE
jgi:hypothetical protein